MNRLLPFIRLIRPLNLIMILFTQYMIRFAFIYPVFKMAGFSLQLSEWTYLMFCLGFVFMAAGGYIVNDYNDVQIDTVNRPHKVIIGNGVTPVQALRLYWALSIAGIAMGVWAAYKAGLPGLGLLFFIYLSGLWFYSTSLKYIFFAGNLLIAIFLALVPFTAGLVELYADVANPYFTTSNINLSFLLYGVSGISVFAFLLTLAREIVKDMEDMEGDSDQGCRTLPIVLGIKTTKKVVGVFMLAVFALLCYFENKTWHVKDWYSLAYCIVCIDIPLIIVFAKLSKATTSAEFHKVSNWIKLLMVSGISYLFVFTYVCLHAL